MPPIDPSRNRAVRPPRRYGAVGRGADTTAAPPRRKSAPAPKPAGVFNGPPRPATRPITQARERAGERNQRAQRRLPAAPIAAPPVIHNPTPQQTQAAKRQITESVNRAVGTARGAERNRRRDEVYRQIRTDSRYRQIRRSVEHWQREEAKIRAPQTSKPARPGPQPRRARVSVGPLTASIDLTGASRTVTNAVTKAAPGLAAMRATPEGRFAKAAISDIAHLPIMGPQLAYELGAAAYEGARGDSTRAKSILKGFTEGVYGLAVQGKWSELEDYVREHPVYALLELRGGKGVVGRGAGAAMRSGALGTAAKRAASTRREDIDLAGGTTARVADRQHYSPDVITKAVQVGIERMRGGGKTALRDHRLRRRADFESDTAAATSRALRADEGHQARVAMPVGPLGDVVGLIVQGVVRPRSIEADLRKELARLDRAHATAEFSTGAQRRQNRVNAGAIRKVLADSEAMARLPELARSARANVRAINELEGRAARLGAITPERAERAKLFPAAQAHLGAEYSDAPFRAARGREVAAGRALRAERVRLTQKVEEIRQTERRAAESVTALAKQHKSDRAREGHNQPIAAYYAGDRRFMLRKDAIEHAKANNIPLKRIRRVALTSGEAKRVGQLSAARRNHQAARRRRLAAQAELRALNRRGVAAVPARKAFEDARSERQAAQTGGTRSLNVAGRRITNDEIRARAGLEGVAYLPHHTKARGARAYYQTQFAGRKNLDASKRRTGAAFEKGADDRSYQAVTEHRVRMRGVVNRIAEHDKIIHSIAITGPKTKANPGGLMTWDQAEKIASNAADGGAKLVPYRAVPGSYDRARMQRIVDSQSPAETPDLAKLIETEFADRLKEPPAGDKTARNVVLVPEEIVNQLKQQQSVSSTAGRAGNIAADVFRRTVLPFSTRWLTGNLVEAGVRLAAVGAGPNSYRIGRNLLREIEKLDREEAVRVRAALTGGLLFGNRGLTVKRVSEHFEGSALAKPATAVSIAGQLPVVKQLGQLMRHYTDGVFALNRWVESSSQVAALGKYAKRDMQEMTGSWAKATRAQEKALQDVARGMLDSKNVHDAARYIDQTLGQYSRFSPPVRRFIQQAAPFLPWYVNAARWVLWTLPAKHPIKTGIMANVAANLQADFDQGHQGLPPGDLRGEIVTDDGTVLPYGRFTPFGAFGSVLGGGDEQLTALVDPLFPQFKSTALAAFGLNFSGHQAKLPPQDRGDRGGVPGAVRASMALSSLLEAFVPAVGIARRGLEGGSTGYDNSTIWDVKTKPGTRVKGGAARRILDPFRPVPGVKGTSQSAISAGRAPVSRDEIDRALDAAAAALDDGALDDEVSRALDVIP